MAKAKKKHSGGGWPPDVQLCQKREGLEQELIFRQRQEQGAWMIRIPSTLS